MTTALQVHGIRILHAATGSAAIEMSRSLAEFERHVIRLLGSVTSQHAA